MAAERAAVVVSAAVVVGMAGADVGEETGLFQVVTIQLGDITPVVGRGSLCPPDDEARSVLWDGRIDPCDFRETT